MLSKKSKGETSMKFYLVSYTSFENHDTERFFCNKAEAWKWVREQRKHTQAILSDPDDDGCTPFFEDIFDPYPAELKSTRKKDIANFINHYTGKP